MSDPTLADKSLATAISEALALYKSETGTTLAPGDPRRLHMQVLITLLVQQRGNIDFAGKQSLLRFVSDEWIDELAALWGEERLPAAASECTQRFTFSDAGAHTVPAGTRVTDGTNLWEVIEDTTETGGTVDATVRCTAVGSATNGVAIGQIDTLVDPDDLSGVTGVTNTTETTKGREIESLEEFRTRLRDVPESRSTCGPRTAYQAAALEVSPTVVDAVALGPDDGGDMAGYPPGDGEVWILVIEGTRDEETGAITSVVPTPDAGLLTAVEEALTPEDVRPLTDYVTAMAPDFVDYDTIITFYIARSRSNSASEIQTAVQEAYEAYQLWQQSKIGRDINPDELRARLLNAGAKRVTVTEPAFTQLMRDQSARLSYSFIAYGGVEDD